MQAGVLLEFRADPADVHMHACMVEQLTARPHAREPHCRIGFLEGGGCELRGGGATTRLMLLCVYIDVHCTRHGLQVRADADEGHPASNACALHTEAEV